MRFALLLSISILFWLSPLLAAPPKPERLEDAVYVYGLFNGASGCSDLEGRLKALRLRSTVILSVEPDPGFLLDLPDGEEQLTCVLSYLRKTSRKAKALFLQDPVFLERSEVSAGRARLLGSFAASHPGLLAAAQVDIEPYTTGRWSCCGLEGRRALLRDTLDLLGMVREELSGLPLGVLLPWWFPGTSDHIPQAAPRAFFGVVDELYLMAYGEEGGPAVGGTAKRVLDRVDVPEVFSGPGRVYIGLATYEFRSPNDLQNQLKKVRNRLARRPTFAGTAVFHATSAYNVPGQPVFSASKVCQTGRKLPGAGAEAAGILSRPDYCGNSSLRESQPHGPR
jgi:hypothetical protein